MAKGAKKKTARPQKTRFGIVMTNRIRLFLIACFIFGFVVVSIIVLGVRL